MHALTRIVRVHLNPADPRDEPPRGDNGFAGVPAPRGLTRFYEFEVRCVGDPDPGTDYLIDIKDVDRAVRSTVVPPIATACRDDPGVEPARLMQAFIDPLAAALPAPLDSVTWRLSPYHCLKMCAASRSTVLIRQRFDFAASHRLHRPELTEEENRRLYGKCNNPAGHGHNYRLEPCIELDLDQDGISVWSSAEIERITRRTILDRFDHAHLNEDTDEFGLPGGVNPSVENIARVFFELLAPAIERTDQRGARLRSVTVWETDRTHATYPG